MKVSILTAGKDPHYALGLLSGLISKGIDVDFIGNDSMKESDIIRKSGVVYHNLRGDQSPESSYKVKTIRVLKYYGRLLKYAAQTDAQLFHILWLNKFTYFDMTILNTYYKLLGKKLVFTAHNVNIGERDGTNTLMNRLCLRFMYKIVDHVFVHTEKMKHQLVRGFDLRQDKVTVIPFGINDVMPRSGLTKEEARKRLNLQDVEKIILFFGNVAAYKGLEYLIQAMVKLKTRYADLRLIIAGGLKNGRAYWVNIQKMVDEHKLRDRIIEIIGYIPDEEVEVYFKSADVSILPYTHIFQSGVLFLAYSFGLPVIATDVGSLRDEIVEGRTGFICRPEDPEDLAKTVEAYFESELFKNLEANRRKIMDYTNERHSWNKIGEQTLSVYGSLL